METWNIIHAVVTHCNNHPRVCAGNALSIDSKKMMIDSTIGDDELNEKIFLDAIQLLRESRQENVHCCYGGTIFVALSLKKTLFYQEEM